MEPPQQQDANQDPPRSEERRGSSGSWRPGPHHLLRWTLAGLPELELFETNRQRDAALDEIGSEVHASTASWWQGFLLVVISISALLFLTKYLLKRINLPATLEEYVPMIVVAAGFVLLLRQFHRRSMRVALRDKLLGGGYPRVPGLWLLPSRASPGNEPLPRMRSPAPNRR